MNFIGKILPNDGFFVQFRGELPVDYAISLTHLYQPLIGIQAVMLYQTLLHEYQLQSSFIARTHHVLMNYLLIPLDEIYKARLKLEGIGLLNTYEVENKNHSGYMYELQSPFAPNTFFQDAMLSQLLYHHLGQHRFDQLKNTLIRKSHSKDKRNITATFHEVFETFQPTSETVKHVPELQGESMGPQIEMMDFTWMSTMLKQRMIPSKKVLTKENKRIISQMQILYQLANYEVESCVLWALNEENEFDVEEFKQACHDKYSINGKNIPIKLSVKDEPSKQEESQTKPKTKEERLIHTLEMVSPQQLLANLSSGNQASAQDLKAVRDVMLSQGLTPPVMNVLIHYVLLQSNMGLSKAYMEKIASHWSRANLKTAKQAMEFAKKQQKQFEANKTKQQYRTPYYRQQKQTEVIPDWFKERKTKQKEKQKESLPNQQKIDVQKEKERMAAFIKEHATNQKK